MFEEFNKPFSFNTQKVKDKQQKKILVCNGSDCTSKGSQGKLRRELEKYFKHDQIGNINCIGLCSNNSAFRYKEKNYSSSCSKTIKHILNQEKLAD